MEEIYHLVNEWDRMSQNRLYNPNCREIERPHNRGMRRVERFNRIPLFLKGAKKRALDRLIPSSKGKELCIFAPFYCEYGINIEVGEECFVNYDCVFLDVGKITLGNHVYIGAKVTLATPCHPFAAQERIPKNYPDGYHDLEYALPITIEDNCWISSGAIINGGVTIHRNSIVASGAVVTRDVPENSIVAGVPARVVRNIDEDDWMNTWKTYTRFDKPLSKRKKEADVPASKDEAQKVFYYQSVYTDDRTNS
jgi:maltose O-acetyltransferase